MEKFSVHQKLLFRTEVLKKAMEIGNMSNPHETNRSDSAHSFYSVSDLTYPQGFQSVPVISGEGDDTQHTFTVYDVEASKTSGAGNDEVHLPSLWYYEHLSFLDEKTTPTTEVIDNMDTNSSL
ncbi:hypothetical protein ACJJTC_004015 [Scirpophaga incertulas]